MNKDISYYLSLNYDINLRPISEEDGGGWLASIPLLEGCISDGSTPNEALENLEDAKIDWLEFCLEENLPIPEPITEDESRYSGKFTLRVGKRIHMQLVKRAESEGISLNSLVSGYITAGLKEQAITNELVELFKEKIKPDIKIVVNHKRSASKQIFPMNKDWNPWNLQHQSRAIFEDAQYDRGVIYE